MNLEKQVSSEERTSEPLAPKREKGGKVGLTQWQLAWRRFRKHKVGMAAFIVLIVFYLSAVFAGFLSPEDSKKRNARQRFKPPQIVRFWDDNGLSRPFVYGMTRVRLESGRRIFVEDRTKKYPIKFFVRDFEYRILVIFSSNLHLIGVDKPGTLFLLGSGDFGRDLFARILVGAQVSLTIGLVGVFLSLILGSVMGTVSGYFGGWFDNIIQRSIEVLQSFPRLPLWMMLGAVVPIDIPPLWIYFSMTTILAIVGWTGLARVIRGKILSLREYEYSQAAAGMGANNRRIIFKHLLPGCYSHILVVMTLSIPSMILAETSLSFLGLGIQPPMISWGVLLQQAVNVRAIGNHPWIMMPVVFIIITVLSYNFVGDGLRDAFDPYSQ